MLAVGPGGLDKDGKRIAPSVAAGDKVLIPQVRCHSKGNREHWFKKGSANVYACSMVGARSRCKTRSIRCLETTSEFR